MSDDNDPGSDALPPVLTDVTDGVATLTLNNPRRKNAITLEMAQLITDFCDRVESDGQIGAVIVRANGEYFCSLSLIHI